VESLGLIDCVDSFEDLIESLGPWRWIYVEWWQRRDSTPRPRAYEGQAKSLAAKFIENFGQFDSDVPREVMNAGPTLEGG
jgi:hypothetical protein